MIIKDSAVNNKLQLEPELVSAAKLDDNSLTVAKVHNLVLAAMDGSIELSNDYTVNDNDSSFVAQVFNDQEFTDSCKYIADNLDDVIENTNDLPSSVMKLFKNVLDTYSTKSNDIAYVIGKYQEVVNNSNELTEDQKRYIGYGLAVALYSAQYWGDIEN